MMTFATVLRHGALGGWDEIGQAVLAILLAALLFWTWRRSQRFEPELEDEDDQ